MISLQQKQEELERRNHSDSARIIQRRKRQLRQRLNNFLSFSICRRIMILSLFLSFLSTKSIIKEIVLVNAFNIPITTKTKRITSSSSPRISEQYNQGLSLYLNKNDHYDNNILQMKLQRQKRCIPIIQSSISSSSALSASVLTSQEATTTMGNTKDDGMVQPGSDVDLSRMDVVGSEYSNEYPMDAVVYCQSPAIFDGDDVLEKAQVVLSMGPDPEGDRGGNGNGGDDDEYYELEENEYAVKRGTKIDKTRMYVLDYEPSVRYEGGVVLRTLNPGVIDANGNTLHLADVIVSSGADGTWKPERPGGGTDGSGNSNMMGDPSFGRRSEGMVAFSSGTLGPPGGPGRQNGYIYGPTEKKKKKEEMSYNNSFQQATTKSSFSPYQGGHKGTATTDNIHNGMPHSNNNNNADMKIKSSFSPYQGVHKSTTDDMQVNNNGMSYNNNNNDDQQTKSSFSPFQGGHKTTAAITNDDKSNDMPYNNNSNHDNYGGNKNSSIQRQQEQQQQYHSSGTGVTNGVTNGFDIPLPSREQQQHFSATTAADSSNEYNDDNANDDTVHYRMEGSNGNINKNSNNIDDYYDNNHSDYSYYVSRMQDTLPTHHDLANRREVASNSPTPFSEKSSSSPSFGASSLQLPSHHQRLEEHLMRHAEKDPSYYYSPPGDGDNGQSYGSNNISEHNRIYDNDRYIPEPKLQQPPLRTHHDNRNYDSNHEHYNIPEPQQQQQPPLRTHHDSYDSLTNNDNSKGDIYESGERSQQHYISNNEREQQLQGFNDDPYYNNQPPPPSYQENYNNNNNNQSIPSPPQSSHQGVNYKPNKILNYAYDNNDFEDILELAENEYSVNRRTKLDKTRMYVMEMVPSRLFEGGTVIKTITPGVVDEMNGNIIHLAEVIVSTGPNGDWQTQEQKQKYDTMNMYTDNDNDNGRTSRGMVAFSSSGSLGPPGGPGRQDEGYTYGPTIKGVPLEREEKYNNNSNRGIYHDINSNDINDSYDAMRMMSPPPGRNPERNPPPPLPHRNDLYNERMIDDPLLEEEERRSAFFDNDSDPKRIRKGSEEYHYEQERRGMYNDYNGDEFGMMRPQRQQPPLHQDNYRVEDRRFRPPPPPFDDRPPMRMTRNEGPDDRHVRRHPPFDDGPPMMMRDGDRMPNPNHLRREEDHHFRGGRPNNLQPNIDDYPSSNYVKRKSNVKDDTIIDDPYIMDDRRPSDSYDNNNNNNHNHNPYNYDNLSPEEHEKRRMMMLDPRLERLEDPGGLPQRRQYPKWNENNREDANDSYNRRHPDDDQRWHHDNRRYNNDGDNGSRQVDREEEERRNNNYNNYAINNENYKPSSSITNWNRPSPPPTPNGNNNDSDPSSGLSSLQSDITELLDTIDTIEKEVKSS